MACDIIIPIWNQFENTRNCLRHLVRNAGHPYRLILIDNGSGRDTKRYLEDFAAGRQNDIKLVRNENNLGFVKAVNQGLRISDAPYICVMNNDTAPGPRWLDNMIEFARTHKDIGLMNPLSSGHLPRTIEEYSQMVGANNKGRYMEMNQCFGFCMLIKREVVDRIGLLDERFGIGGYDDTDYSMRAWQAGWRCASVHSSYVYHKEHASFDAMGDRRRLVSAGEEEYFRKWPRHLRIGIGVSPDGAVDDTGVENLLKAVLYLAREWCWVNLWVFGNADENRERVRRLSKKADMPLHQNIKFNYLPGAFMAGQLLARLIERSFGSKRRKRYDIVIVDNVKTNAFLNAFSLLHKTKTGFFDFCADSADYARKLINEQRAKSGGQRI